MLEMQLVVAMVAQHFRLDLVPGFPVIPHPRSRCVPGRPDDDADTASVPALMAATRAPMSGEGPPQPRTPRPHGTPSSATPGDSNRTTLGTLLDGWRDSRRRGPLPGRRAALPGLPARPPGPREARAAGQPSRTTPRPPFVNDKWRMVVGEGLICSEGDFWRRQRRLAQPAFHRQLHPRVRRDDDRNTRRC